MALVMAHFYNKTNRLKVGGPGNNTAGESVLMCDGNQFVISV
jgi:hypothetical protein